MKILAYLSLFLISFTALVGVSEEPGPASPLPEPTSLDWYRGCRYGDVQYNEKIIGFRLYPPRTSFKASVADFTMNNESTPTVIKVKPSR